MEGNIKPVSNPWNRPFKVGDTIKRPNGKELYQISSYGITRLGRYRKIKAMKVVNVRTNKSYIYSVKSVIQGKWVKWEYITPKRIMNKHKMV